MSITGYYHIFKNEEDKQLDDFEETKRVAQGQLKMTIKVNKPLLYEFNIQDTELEEHNIMIKNLVKEKIKEQNTTVFPIEETKVPDDVDESPLSRARRMAQELREKTKDDTRRLTAAHLTRVSLPRPTESALSGEENEDANIPSDINELRVKKDQNILDLQNLTNMLKSRIGDSRDDLDDPDNQDDDLDRATLQEFAE